MHVSTAAHQNIRLTGYQKPPENRQKKRTQQQDKNNPLKKIKLETTRINHQEHDNQTRDQKKLPKYQVAIAKGQPIHQNSQKSKLQVDSKQSAETHSIPTILNRILDDIRKMDIEYAISSDKSAQMPEHKRLPIHGNFTCIGMIYEHLLVPKIHHLIQELSPVNDLKQHQAKYARHIAELVKTYKVAQCDEMTHLMASCCLENPDISLFKMVVSFFSARAIAKKGRMQRSSTHVCLLVCPRLSGDSVQMQSQWYEAEHKHAHSDLHCADGSYHQPSYMATSDIYIADPCQHEFWPGSQWQQFISNIADQYLTPTGKDFKKIKVQITPYHSEAAVMELPAEDVQTAPVSSDTTDYSAMQVYSYLEEFVKKPINKPRAADITMQRLIRNSVKIPSFEIVKSSHRKKWSTNLIRVLAWKMNLDVKVLHRTDLAIINPKSEDYYQYMIDFLGKSTIESSMDVIKMTKSFNNHGFPFPEPCSRYFLPSEEWLPGHIRHLIRLAKPERSFSDYQLIKVLKVLNPVELQDTYLRYLHEYLQNKLVKNQGPRVLENAIGYIRRGKIPPPAIQGMTSWNILTLRKLADLCVKKFGGISAKMVVPDPSAGKKEVIPTSPNKFAHWFLNKLTNCQFDFNRFNGSLKTANRIVNITPIEGITFDPVPQKADWMLYYIYQFGFDKKEIYYQASSTTLYQLLKRITSPEKHTELYDRLLYLSSTCSGLHTHHYWKKLKEHNIKLPDDLMNYTVKSRIIEMQARAEKLKESGWLTANIDLSYHKKSKHKKVF
ncbi:hypothetical protein [Endozoicomonas sp. GU-1]|uniref:hypothetical protein n=1 Tax=Endozoicomonas sp. GU-1 TaxID=3009078 RepID=UPI0022B390AD|nr:hypothetical protein [Endozoicomonas sp. GU-1]WBA79798.1 hypothetical protein O2T12_15670 [Endozoicomonas sp. GU-1]WBA87378.1 hypothetical protein O3276_04930 [Endozoicomonas sp. GU-1]